MPPVCTRAPRRAALRSARLGLAQAYYSLEEQEQRVQRTVTKQYQKLNEWHRRIEIAGAERQAYAKSVESLSHVQGTSV